MLGDSTRSILVASDLGRESDRVVGAAAALAAQTGASLHVVHALEFVAQPILELAFGVVQTQSIVRDARRDLQEQLRRVLPPDVATGTVKLAYHPAPEAILRRATEVDADLIVVGPHRGGLPGIRLLGTTAQRVVESAAVPCLVATRPLPASLRRVVVPLGVDGIGSGP